MKRKKLFLVFWLILLLTLVNYSIFSFIDYSSKYFGILRGIVMLFDVIFFSLLAAKVPKQSKFSFISADFILSGMILFIVHIIVTMIATDLLNEKIISYHNESTTGIIKNCDETKEYCIYSYTVGNSNYEMKFDNSENDYKYDNLDSVIVLYCPQIPSISKLQSPVE